MAATEAVRPAKVSKMDPKLVPINAVAERWSKADRQHSPLHPLERMRLMHDGAVLGGAGGDTADVECFDKGYCAADQGTKAILNVWYRNTGSVDTKAKRIGCSREDLYREWRAALVEMKGFMRAHGFPM